MEFPNTQQNILMWIKTKEQKEERERERERVIVTLSVKLENNQITSWFY